MMLVGLLLAAPRPAAALQAQSISEIQVTPETMTLGVGQKQALFAAAFDARGNLMASAKFTFWSSDTLIAKVRKDGSVVGVAPGLAKIEARSNGRRASMAVLITGSAPTRIPGSACRLWLDSDPGAGISDALPRGDGSCETGGAPGRWNARCDGQRSHGSPSSPRSRR